MVERENRSMQTSYCTCTDDLICGNQPHLLTFPPRLQPIYNVHAVKLEQARALESSHERIPECAHGREHPAARPTGCVRHAVKHQRQRTFRYHRCERGVRRDYVRKEEALRCE